MFVKIFYGESQKFKLIQSDDVTLDKASRMIHSELYPIMCAYIEEMSLPVGEENGRLIEALCDSFASVARVAYNDENILMSVSSAISGMFPNTAYKFLCPVLSDEEAYHKNEWRTSCNSSKEKPLCACNKKLSIVEIDGKKYITSGPIFVMNDDGKTVEKNA